MNTFANGARYIAGNRCDKPLKKQSPTSQYNMYDYKRELLNSYKPCTGPPGHHRHPHGPEHVRSCTPFWYTFFTKLGFGVFHSRKATASSTSGASTPSPRIPVCYPAKLMHGHIEALLDQKPDAIFYPCMSYNLTSTWGQPLQLPRGGLLSRGAGRQHRRPEDVKFIYDYVGLHRRKDFPGKMTNILAQYFDPIPEKEVKAASDAAYEEYYAHMERIHKKGQGVSGPGQGEATCR